MCPTAHTDLQRHAGAGSDGRLTSLGQDGKGGLGVDQSSQEEAEQPGSPAGSESSISREVCMLVPTAQRGSELMESKRAQLREERHQPFWNSVGLTVLGLSQQVGRAGL